tara:strand:- start:10 stop:720 length:711 start_codon:yes stop_codon:yes gene_type:complete
MIKNIKGRLIERIKRTQDVESFRFSTQERIDFLPGQFLQTIFNEENLADKELNKYLSFSSSPAKDYIEVTKRMSQSRFSQKLNSLKSGVEVLFKSPLGNCIFKDEYKKIAFLIGGIGITPVISIIEYIVDKKINTDVIVLYSNKTEDIAFREELDYWQSTCSNIKVIYAVTECRPKDVNCIAGSITKDLLLKVIDDWRQRVFFIFGPPNMIGAMNNLCSEAGCDRELVKVETFTGY